MEEWAIWKTAIFHILVNRDYGTSIQRSRNTSSNMGIPLQDNCSTEKLNNILKDIYKDIILHSLKKEKLEITQEETIGYYFVL